MLKKLMKYLYSMVVPDLQPLKTRRDLLLTRLEKALAESADSCSTVFTDNFTQRVVDVEKKVPWDRLHVDVLVKELSEGECRDILIRTYPNERDYKLYVLSRCIYDLVRLLKHIRLYSEHYGEKEDVLFDELFSIAMSVNPLLTTKFKKAGHATRTQQGKPCAQEEEEQEKRFADVTKEEILSLGDRVKKRVLGQGKAIDKIVLAIQRASAGLRDPEQPIGSFLLTGPTGCGKTLFAKVLTEELVGDRKYIVRVDCSEYQQKYETSKLIGAAPGYIGYDDGGILTNAMKKAPFSVVLFDEIEKAHTNVYNLLLQIMDEGILTSSAGDIVTFKDTVVIMTSNLGVAEAVKAQREVGFEKARTLDDSGRVDAMEVALKKNFKPEFLNRLDAVSHFMPLLDEDICKEIVVIELELLLKHLYTNKQMTVKYNSDVIDFIYKKGFNAEYGARPLKRAIRKYFANVLSHMILAENPEKGTALEATLEDSKIIFSKVAG